MPTRTEIDRSVKLFNHALYINIIITIDKSEDKSIIGLVGQIYFI